MHAVSGGVYINDNAIGCNSSSEIKTTYRGDITVTTQAAVDSLRTTLSGKTRIVGNLTIGYASGSSQSDINDLTLLSTMSHITGDLIIRKNGQLVHLNALTRLQSVGGGFSVSNNDQLTTLDNFPILTSIGMGNNVYIPSLGNSRNNVSIVVEENPRLSDCYELTEFILGGATAVSGDIYINDNAIGCNSENDIKIRYRGNITVTTQAEVNALRDTLSDKTILVGNLTIGYASGNSRSDITDLTPLSSITDITGDVLIQQNGKLVNLNALTRLESIGGYFSVSSNDILTSLGKFPTLTSIGVGEAFVPSLDDDTENISIVVEENPRLSDCHELTEFISDGATVVSGDIYINDNAIGCNSENEIKTTYIGDVTVTTQAEVNALSDTLSGKTIIEGNLTIGYTSGSSRSDITDLTPLGNVVRITGNIRIQQNGVLVNLNGLDSLQSIGGYFQVRSNAKLTDLGDFPDLESIGGYFLVEGNSKLTDLGDFPDLQTIGGYFNVNSNRELTDLGDFSDLQSIGGYFNVNNNDVLTTLGDFPDLESIGGYFLVEGNSKLTDLGDFPDLQTIGGFFRVNNNDKLTDLGNFPDLQTIGGFCRVYSNRELTTLGNFPDLQTIGGFFSVYSNGELTDLGDFPILTSIGMGRAYVPSLHGSRSNISIVVEENPRLSDCYYVLTDFLPGGTHAVSGGIYINNNAIGCNSQNGIINTVYQGSITVRTQAEANTLLDTLSGKTIINGNLTIGYTSGSSRSDIDSLKFFA